MEHSPSPKLYLRRYSLPSWEGRIDGSTAASTKAVNVLDQIDLSNRSTGNFSHGCKLAYLAAVAGARLKAHATVSRTMDIRFLSICADRFSGPVLVPSQSPWQILTRGFQLLSLAASLIQKSASSSLVAHPTLQTPKGLDLAAVAQDVGDCSAAHAL